MFRITCFLTFTVMLIACGSEDAGAGDGAATFECSGATPAAEACCEFSQATIDTCVRCGLGSESQCIATVENAVESQSSGQGCEGADAIRDEASFYDDCLPAVDVIDCTAFTNGDLPASCQDQIQFYM